MLVTKPQLITLPQIASLAACAHNRIAQIYLHWTAGRYGQIYSDYHLNIDADAPSTAPAPALLNAKTTPGTVTAAASASHCAALWGRRPTMATTLIWAAMHPPQRKPTSWRR